MQILAIKDEHKAAYRSLVNLYGDAIFKFADSQKLDCLVFGGALRDVYRHLYFPEFPQAFPLEVQGDLDIVCLKKSAKILLEWFVNQGATVSLPPEPTNNSGEYEEWGSIEKPVDVLYLNKKIQLIICKPKNYHLNETPKELIMKVVCDVDIRCCGLMMTMDGRTFETVPQALLDCSTNHLNLPATPGYSANLEARIEKLVSRGWINNITKEKETATFEQIQWP